MKVLVPLTTMESPSGRNSVFMPVASDPAVGSVIVNDAMPPFAITGSSRFFCASVPKSISGLIAWKLVAQTMPVDAHAFDSSRTHSRYAAYDICAPPYACLLYTSDAADERSSVDLGGRRIIKKKK